MLHKTAWDMQHDLIWERGGTILFHLSAASPAMAEGSQAILETFKKFDADGSGCIDREELGAVLKALEGKFDNESIDSLLLQADSSFWNRLAALLLFNCWTSGT